jgi:hypothetical protein
MELLACIFPGQLSFARPKIEKQDLERKYLEAKRYPQINL